MTHVATLIAAGPGGLDDALVARAQAALPNSTAPRWLSQHEAADLPFSPDSGIDQRALAARLRAALGAPVDVVVQPVAHRRKKLFLADMDSTMIGQECIDELADYVGLKAHVATITERAMRGEIAFEPALRERVALLKGMPVGVEPTFSTCCAEAGTTAAIASAATAARPIRFNGIAFPFGSGRWRLWRVL